MTLDSPGKPRARRRGVLPIVLGGIALASPVGHAAKTPDGTEYIPPRTIEEELKRDELWNKLKERVKPSKRERNDSPDDFRDQKNAPRTVPKKK